MGLVCIFFLLMAYSDDKPFVEKQLCEMDEQIDKLENLKKQHQKNIKKHLSLAHRWQGNKDLSLESRREYLLAENLQDKLSLLERKLVKLKKEKEEIQEK